jgi:hypothetical protein
MGGPGEKGVFDTVEAGERPVSARRFNNDVRKEFEEELAGQVGQKLREDDARSVVEILNSAGWKKEIQRRLAGLGSGLWPGWTSKRGNWPRMPTLKR